MQSGSGDDLCNGDIQQLKNCTESETVQRFYFNTSMQKCVEYSTCPFDSPRSNVFDSIESCKESCGDNTRERMHTLKVYTLASFQNLHNQLHTISFPLQCQNPAVPIFHRLRTAR